MLQTVGLASDISLAGTVQEETDPHGALASVDERRGAGGPAIDESRGAGGPAIEESRGAGGPATEESRGAGGPAHGREQCVSSWGMAHPVGGSSLPTAAQVSPSLQYPSTRSPSSADGRTGGESSQTARQAWPERLVTSDKRARLESHLARCVKRRQRLSETQLHAADALDISIPEEALLPLNWHRHSDGVVVPRLASATESSDDESEPAPTRPVVRPTRASRRVSFAPSVVSHVVSVAYPDPSAGHVSKLYPRHGKGVKVVARRLVADPSLRTLTVGDRRARMHDASRAAGWPAVACDLLPCEGGLDTCFFHGDVRHVAPLVRWRRVISFMPCEQQTISLGALASTKALDGRMWWGMVAWLWAWCIAADSFAAEQPDVYIADFYDALRIVTSPSEWDEVCDWQKKTLVFYRGCSPPVPPFPGRRGASAWHNGGGRTATEAAHARDETHVGFARGLAEQIVPDGSVVDPIFAVEVERMAMPFYHAGLPLPVHYNALGGQPCDAAEQEYATSRGSGDGRRLAGVQPLLALSDEQRRLRMASDPHYSSLPAAVRADLLAAQPASLSARGLALGTRAHSQLARERQLRRRQLRAAFALLLAAAREHAADDDGQRERVLSVGSNKPHAADGYVLSQQWAPSGSLRQLEPEQHGVLRDEPLPQVNQVVATDPEDPPPRIVNPPGPFTTDELIPAEAQRKVRQHGRAVRACLRRARSGGSAAVSVARRLRPEALILEQSEAVDPVDLAEHEALNPCGRGFVWRRRPDEDLWDVVQPSSWPDHKPEASSFKGDVFRDDARALGMEDEQLISWGLHGFPGARAMPCGRAVLGFPHAGAIKHAADLEATQKRDIENGFVSHGEEFPQFWPCVCDPMNIVVQHGKPRATIDKTMRLSSSAHPQPVPAYNDYIDLEAERASLGRPLRLVRVWQFARGGAILATANVPVRLGKFDLSTYFRMHGKQLAHVWQSGRVLESLFGFDFCVNFGERDAPDHTCRATDGICFFVRVELRRLQGEYPSKCAKIMEWLAHRLGLSDEAGGDRDFVWVVTFFFVYYVDDAGLAAFADKLYTKSGDPVMVTEYAADGSTSLRHQTRDEMYFQAAMAIAQRYGHQTPKKKQSPMALDLEFLGIMIDMRVWRRYLTREKAKAYGGCITSLLNAKRALPSGGVAVPHDDCNSLLHKLLHASDVVPIGRAHLFYLRQAVKATNGLKWSAVILGERALNELQWWSHQLAHADEHGVPLASRYLFPTGSDTTVVHYADSSREESDLEASGAGAWSVIAGTFVYIEWRWSAEAVRRFSINVLETVVKDVASRVFIAHARSKGLAATHSLAFTDNSTAEHVAEKGRPSTEALHQLNAARQHWLVAQRVSQRSERVASIDNDVADLLSRGDVAEALRFAEASQLPIERLAVEPAEYDTSALPPTWA